ncbi:hypothetical protein F2Q70_00044914 [Brassica cretica]|uniref:CBS domain-containing protein n=1 Tax=Brassica cretica TaxID=69181 RepID=A0A8S9KLG0_BRACR|nr:hypothetical protein F2Q70_00044914 [Brassica cretica]
MSSRSFSDFLQTSFVGGGGGGDQNGTAATKAKKFSSRSIGFNPTSPTRLTIGRSMYRGRSAPLTCKTSSSLAAVMAQMLSHRATHVWVTEADSDDDDILVGVVGYGEILAAVTKQPSAFVPSNRPATSKASSRDKFCCLSREDVIRFLIGVLGALAPLPLTSISSLGIINVNYNFIEASLPAIEATKRPPCDPSAIAVLEQSENNEKQFKIIGEISASKLWKCDYLAAAWALANLYAGQFVMGVEDNMSSRSFSDFLQTSFVGGGGGGDQNGTAATKAKKFSSRSIGFNPTSPTRLTIGRSMYRGRSAPLTCKTSSSLAAVMAQMLSHRATHVWVTEADSDDDDILVGVVGYGEILAAVTKQPSAFVPSNRSYEGGFGNEHQSKSFPCKKVQLIDINLEHKGVEGGPSTAVCENVDGYARGKMVPQHCLN